MDVDGGDAEPPDLCEYIRFESLTLLQWNCRSIRNKKPDIIHLINSYNPSILAISETWLKPGSPFRIPGFSCYRSDRSDGYGGALILLNRTIPLSPIQLPPILGNINAVAVKALDITILSIYIPSPTPSCIPELNLILSSISPPYIVLGDFNSHHVMWGSHKTDSFSYLLLDVFNEFNLCLLNDGSPTRMSYPSQNTRSVGDLSLCSPILAASILWKTLPSSFGSYHFPILLNLSNRCVPARSIFPLFKFNLSEADWDVFSSESELYINNLPPVSLDNFQSVYSQFITLLNNIASKIFPLKNSSTKKISSPPWWDRDCSSIIRKRKAAERLYSSYMTMENFLDYQKIAAQTKKLLSEKKKKGWLSFCESLSPRSPSSLVWQSIRRFRGALNYSNPPCADPSHWLDDFSNRLAPPWVLLEEEIFPNSKSFPPQPSNSLNNLNEPFSIAELQLVLRHLKDSTPGIDGIPYSFLVNMGTKCKQFFLNMINFAFTTGSIPHDWKTHIIIPILKSGKDPSSSSSYRPIAISSTLSKIMEHLVKNRLEWILENRGIIPKSQFGFRKGFSTMDSLSIFVSDIRLAFSNNNFLVGVFIDVCAAYDNVVLPLLRQKMHQLNIPERITNFVSNLLSHRRILVRSEGRFLPARFTWKGLPQGSVLSPLLYSLYTHDLDRSVNYLGNVLQYADDIALFVTDASTAKATSRLSQAVNYLNNWLFEHGLSISPLKCSTVVFSRRRQIPEVSIYIENTLIPTENQVKFLGVILYNKMTGIPHLSYIASKCEKNLNVIRSLSGAWWGSHPYSQKLLYNALIRSHFDYGCFLLEPCSKMALNTLDKIQSKCLRIITGAMKSTPISALQVECVEPPLFLRRQYLSDRFLFKAASYSHHPLLSKLRSLYQSVRDSPYWSHKDLPCIIKSYIKLVNVHSLVYQSHSNPLFNIPYEALIFNPDIILNFGIDKNTIEVNNKLNMLLLQNWHDWLIMYTDASKLSDEGLVGSAVWIPKYKIILNFNSPPDSSVFTGESLAILEAVLYAESHNLERTLIFSDSLICLQSIASSPFHSKIRYPLILNIRKSLFNCHKKGLKIVLAWIPSHCGIQGNDIADHLAKEAAKSGSLPKQCLYTYDLLPKAGSSLLSTWQSIWHQSKLLKYKHYSKVQINIPSKPWFFQYRHFNKSITSTVCRLRFGHACTPVHLAKLRIRDSSICECGLDEGSVNHLFFECPNLSHFLYDILPHYIPRPVNFQYLLPLVYIPFVNILCDFIRTNNIKL
ncbi:unnamed protein product [Parnassius mnemosyne]|uniref:RNA-directed DNA polymerase from mobile element jockey n=1 Tax=Parnassius mnemosyne TaxID=213953 RepID=A0AAV1LQK0_9NEOP